MISDGQLIQVILNTGLAGMLAWYMVKWMTQELSKKLDQLIKITDRLSKQIERLLEEQEKIKSYRSSLL